MEPLTCTRCGVVIEGEGIRHRRRLFCGDECCESFEDGFLNHGGPAAEDLEADDTGDVEVFEEEFFDDDENGDDAELDDDELDDDRF